MSLNDALDSLLGARKRLEVGQGYRSRRTARNEFARQLRYVVDEFDRNYPRIRKPPTARQQRSRLVLLTAHHFSVKTATLYLKIAAHLVGTPPPRVRSAPEYANWTNSLLSDGVFVSPAWSSERRWRLAIKWAAWAFKAGGMAAGSYALATDPPPPEYHNRARKLYNDFFTKQLLLDDLALAAEHFALLQKRKAVD